MGLDTTHNCWHGSYGSFARFRDALARQIGINLDEYEGFGGEKEFITVNHDIVPLLNHSDCDGDLDVEDCKKVVNGLNSILENFNETLEFDPNFKDKIIQFRDGCLDAISNNEIVEFY